METKKVDDYLTLPYTILAVPDSGDEYRGWFARVVELPGCMTQADTFAELGEMIQDAMRAWIETALEDGQDIPEPKPAETYSGKFIVRVPRSLHRMLAEGAENEGVSLNAFISATLGMAVGEASFTRKANQADEPTSLMNWPRLMEPARQIMLAHGYHETDQEIDETIFAAWLENHLDQIQTAIEHANYQEALQYLLALSRDMEKACAVSPILRTYKTMVIMLESQVKTLIKLRGSWTGNETFQDRTISELFAELKTLREQKSGYQTEKQDNSSE